ncbi:Crp/Fnr family transcriptional regulator [Clostridium sp. NSJ-6]|uniref:Crp/Fnr family transcriptional regulator n=1 Tax=Clostridium hominis TaxID=2763036 RepID=A0ABR7DCM5_9CLOT|nr:Crp/Fnr family transcriptional regulator [Clostridium hominis]MBC5629145.1 Crp/Fnr family transcriptional regulator [Clostridium hominis]MDU2671795.1 Crp/Fnr family transcriptional regulator [Clostridium sp.]
MAKITTKDLGRMDIFKGLSEETLGQLSEYCELKEYKKGKHVFRDKEVVSRIYIVYSGKVSLYKMNESAQKKIVFILGPSKIINDYAIDDLPSSVNCEVFETAEILSIDKNKFLEIMKNDFELTKIFIKSQAIKVRRLYRQMKNSTPIKVEKRVAAKLWKLAKDYGEEVEDGTLINLNISVTYLADMFGAPRETISRALKFLTKEELITHDNKKIIIRDKDRLSKFFKGL